MDSFAPETYRIMVVDDSLSILEIVRTTLAHHGFQVMTAESGEQALELMESEGLPHLGLFDINMPMGMDGLELCERVLQFSDLPIIMLTAVEETSTIVEAIDRYAEDYMNKPVKSGELLARVRRVLRTIGQFAYPLTASFVPVDEALSVNFATLTAVVKGSEVSLTPTEAKLLYILMRQKGKVVNTDFLLRRLWPADTDFADEDRLRVYVHRLRSKIEVKGGPRYVFSKRRKGYAFLPDEK